jgi:hypothetical protein
MTYSELAYYIKKMTKEQQESNVTVCETHGVLFFAVDDIEYADENNVDQLEHGHPFLTYDPR